MSRKITRYINRFDGGITDDIRNTSDLSRCAHVSHFDIYTNPYRLKPMPGFVSDQDTTVGADDLQNYNIKAFYYRSTSGGTLLAVGTKADGTGSKLFSKATPTTAQWTAVASGEGTYDVSGKTFLAQAIPAGNFRLYWVTTNGGNTYLSYFDTSVTDAGATVHSGSTDISQTVAEHLIDTNLYATTGRGDVMLLTNSAVTDPACSTGNFVTDIHPGDAQMGIVGYVVNNVQTVTPYQGVFSIWDLTVNPNETLYKYYLGNTRPFALGRDGSQWLVAASDGLGSDTASTGPNNGAQALEIYVTNGPQTERFLRINAETNTNSAFRPVRGTYHGATLFYAKLPTDSSGTTFKQGIWAVGRRNSSSPIALSLLLDMDSFGSLEGYYTFGDHHFFAHGGDGSVSRLDALDDGTYDVTAVYESLIFGSETPFQKIFQGLSVLTEDLPSGASVVAKYRTDTDDSWTTIGTSSTTGAERHNFTRTSSGPIGNFQEIQFRIEVTGKAAIKNITINYEETDDLPYQA